MTDWDLFWTIAIPLTLCSPFIYLLFFWAIPEFKNDAKWYEYDAAWHDWNDNGRVGKMPVSEDFGYVNRYAKKEEE